MDYVENLNYIIDGIILLILIMAMLLGAYRGLIKSVFRILSSILAIIIAFAIHPMLTKFVKMTPLFDALKGHIADKLGLSLTQTAATQTEQTSLIGSLPLPDFVNEMLIENNNTVVHELLDAHGVADYICGYLSNLVISIAVTLILIISMRLIISGVSKSLDLISRLPVIHQLNYAGGGAVGLVSGVLIIWLVFLALMLFVTDTSYAMLQEGIDSSIIGKLLYDNNIFRNVIMGDLF